MTIPPNATTNCDDILGATTCVDSDWEGCNTMRKSTMGFTTTVRGVELYGCCSGTTEMGVLRFLRDCKIKTVGYFTMCKGSTVGKSMAPRLGVRRATRHI